MSVLKVEKSIVYDLVLYLATAIYVFARVILQTRWLCLVSVVRTLTLYLCIPGINIAKNHNNIKLNAMECLELS